MSGKQGVQPLHAGRSRGRDDNFDIGDPMLQGMDQVSANIYLANAHGVHPERVAICNGLL